MNNCIIEMQNDDNRIDVVFNDCVVKKFTGYVSTISMSKCAIYNIPDLAFSAMTITESQIKMPIIYQPYNKRTQKIVVSSNRGDSFIIDMRNAPYLGKVEIHDNDNHVIYNNHQCDEFFMSKGSVRESSRSGMLSLMKMLSRAIV